MSLDETVRVRPGAPAEDDAATPVLAGVIDADVHPTLGRKEELKHYLPKRFWDHLETFGAGGRAGGPYPKAVPEAHRQDAAPPNGMAGSDLDFMRAQYLDPLGIRYAIMAPLRYSGQAETNPDLACAVVRAMNEWQVDRWTSRDSRMKASVLVPIEQPEEAAREIEHWADHPDFAQVLLLTRTGDPLGRRRYWPIFEAAERNGFPVAVHVFGSPGHPSTPGGWPSFYLEEMTSHSAACQGMLASMAIEGLFERFPGLKVISLEGGFAWLPAFEWRLDTHFERFRAEVPHLKRRPSEYLRGQLFVATQPIEEPEKRKHLLDIVNEVGVDRLLFSSDYPHWDFDDPARALPQRLGKAAIEKICSGNALGVYKLSE